MAITKVMEPRLRFEGDGCQLSLNSQAVLEVEVPGGRQTINFSVVGLPAVAALLSEAVADEDVLALIAANTPAPEPEPEGEPIP